MMEEFLKIKKWHSELKSEKGFTVLELIFVILIFGILSTMVLSNFRVFSLKLTFDNLTQDIALKIVSAQKDAMMGTVKSSFIDRDQKPAYGVFFTTASGTSNVKNNQIVSFTDIPPDGASVGDKMYSPTHTNSDCGNSIVDPECISIANITTGEYVDKICFDSTTCGSTISGDVSIVFIRPFPDASIILHRPTTNTATTTASAVCVELVSPTDPSSKRTIKVNSFGQIRTLSLPASSVCT